MDQPEFTDYVHLIYTQFDRFLQHCREWQAEVEGYDYPPQLLIGFFMVMQARHIVQFKTQWRWLVSHPQQRQQLGFEAIPHRTTLSRRYKTLYPLLQAFIAFTGQDAETLDERFESRDLYQDKSLFKAQGPVWHQSDRQGRPDSEAAPPPGSGSQLVEKRVSRLGLRLWAA